MPALNANQLPLDPLDGPGWDAVRRSRGGWAGRGAEVRWLGRAHRVEWTLIVADAYYSQPRHKRP